MPGFEQGPGWADLGRVVNSQHNTSDQVESIHLIHVYTNSFAVELLESLIRSELLGVQPAGVVAVGDKVSVLRVRTDSWAPSVTSRLVGPDSSTCERPSSSLTLTITLLPGRSARSKPQGAIRDV